jgi:hypothetical protein
MSIIENFYEKSRFKLFKFNNFEIPFIKFSAPKLPILINLIVFILQFKKNYFIKF